MQTMQMDNFQTRERLHHLLNHPT